jgi:hypothetical protein
VDTSKRTAPDAPDHELIRRDAAAHPERSYAEHVEAAREIAGRTYLQDLLRISPAAWDSFDPEEDPTH